MKLLKIFLIILLFVSESFCANDENDSERIDRIIAQCADMSAPLRVSRADRQFVKGLIEHYQSPCSDEVQTPKVQISEENVDNFTQAIKEKPFKRKVVEKEMKRVIPQDAFHTPVKINKSEIYYSKGISPQKTPRRKQNLSNMWKGLQPVLISFEDDMPMRSELHHLS